MLRYLQIHSIFNTKPSLFETEIDFFKKIKWKTTIFK